MSYFVKGRILWDGFKQKTTVSLFDGLKKNFFGNVYLEIPPFNYIEDHINNRLVFDRHLKGCCHGSIQWLLSLQ